MPTDLDPPFDEFKIFDAARGNAEWPPELLEAAERDPALADRIEAAKRIGRQRRLGAFDLLALLRLAMAILSLWLDTRPATPNREDRP